MIRLYKLGIENNNLKAWSVFKDQTTDFCTNLALKRTTWKHEVFLRNRPLIFEVRGARRFRKKRNTSSNPRRKGKISSSVQLTEGKKTSKSAFNNKNIYIIKKGICCFIFMLVRLLREKKFLHRLCTTHTPPPPNQNHAWLLRLF